MKALCTLMHVWSNMTHRVYSMPLDSGMVNCMPFALSVLSILGLRYPARRDDPVTAVRAANKSRWSALR